MKKLYMLLVAVLLLAIMACSSSWDPIPPPSSSVKAITAFSLDGVVGTINETGKTIAVAMPFGTDVTALVATFTTTGVSVKVDSTVQESGTTAHSFTSPVTYTVTAADATTQDYTVTVAVASSSAKAITAFTLAGVVGTINETGKTIAVTMPFDTSVTNLVATFTTTGVSVKVGSTVQESGTTAHSFTSPVTYTVTAADATTQDYTVTVAVASSSAKAITAFSLASVAGTIDETGKTIAVTMPFGTSVTNLVATFITDGASVKVVSTVQESGTTAHNFTSPVVYTVTAADSTTQNYTVTVTVAPSTVPGAPTIGTATAGNAQATVTFTAPVSDGGSAITGYTVTSSPGGLTGTGTASPIIVTGLTNETAYTFTVTATNAIGISTASSASNSVTPIALLIGDAYQGGKIAYILQFGDPGYNANVQHGLIATTVDPNLGIVWALSSYQGISVPAPGATGTAIGTGLANTTAIIAQNAAGSNYAAGVCDAWSVTVDAVTYSHWYLPSKDELNKLYLNRVAIGNFDVTTAVYWSSTETAAGYAWFQDFRNGYNGQQIDAVKTNTFRVRAVRAF